MSRICETHKKKQAEIGRLDTWMAFDFHVSWLFFGGGGGVKKKNIASQYLLFTNKI